MSKFETELHRVLRIRVYNLIWDSNYNALGLVVGRTLDKDLEIPVRDKLGIQLHGRLCRLLLTEAEVKHD